MNYQSLIREIPDFPKPGILFRDITPLLASAKGFSAALADMLAPFRDTKISHFVGIESRGFIFGAAAANELGVGFVPVRKRGKLPAKTLGESYALEYGEDQVEIHADALKAGDRVLLIDDLIATGGTALAASKLITRLGATLIGTTFLIELEALGGRAKLEQIGVKVSSALHY